MQNGYQKIQLSNQFMLILKKNIVVFKVMHAASNHLKSLPEFTCQSLEVKY